MEIKWLEDFLCLARTNSFSRAAQERHITQSAFSRRIKALEHWLGTALVDRSTYPTSLTPSGRAFLATAEEVLRTLHVARADLRGAGGRGGERVRFAALHSLALSYFPAWMRAVNAATSPIESSLLADNLHNCVQALIEGDADFLLCFVHPEIPVIIDPMRFDSLSLGPDRLIPVSAAGPDGTALFALPGRASRPLPHLAYGPDAFLGRAVELTIRRQSRRCHLRGVYENSMAEGLKAMALAGHGLAWLPESSIAPLLESRRLVRSGGPEWDVPLEVRLYHASESARAPVARVWSAASALAAASERANYEDSA